MSQKVYPTLRYFNPRKYGAVRHAVTRYWQIVLHRFQSRGRAFPASPLIPSVSQYCFTKARHSTVHSQKQAYRKILPATLSSSSVCQCSRDEQRDVFEAAERAKYMHAPDSYSRVFLFWVLCRVSPLSLLRFHTPDVTDGDGVRLQRECLFLLLYLFFSNALSSWGLSSISNIRRCCSAMIVSRQRGNCRSTRQHVCNSQ